MEQNIIEKIKENSKKFGYSDGEIEYIFNSIEVQSIKSPIEQLLMSSMIMIDQKKPE